MSDKMQKAKGERERGGERVADCIQYSQTDRQSGRQTDIHTWHMQAASAAQLCPTADYLVVDSSTGLIRSLS